MVALLKALALLLFLGFLSSEAYNPHQQEECPLSSSTTVAYYGGPQHVLWFNTCVYLSVIIWLILVYLFLGHGAKDDCQDWERNFFAW